MMNFRRSFLSAVCLALFVSAAWGADPVVLRMNTNISENDLKNSSFGLGITTLVEQCDKLSNGRLKVEVFPHSQLGKTPSEVVGGAQMGSFEMFNLVAGSWGEYTNAFLPVNTPYLFTDEKVLQEFLYGPEGQKIKDKVLADTDTRVVFYGWLGFRNIINNVRPITKPEDLKGLKMRVLSDRYTIKTFETFGAPTIQVSYSELYTASQQGLIDGSDGPFVNIYNSKLYEVQKYLSETRNAYTLAVMCIAEEAYQGLPEDLRDAFDKACAAAQKVAEDNQKFEDACLSELKKVMTFNQLTPEQMKAFEDAAQPVRDMVRQEMGDEAWNAIVKEIETIKARLGK
ncbi:TRAP transporter substrate-binding protein [Pyramidobacter sp. C12-8]|nr:TRAP transporter substrate-binding protein [Pyramidobacter sp. C12-8]OON87586.1 hypothetical protein B0D78_09825 [Pyramidobacter sp. C12-8]RKJ78464.1 TRAP transporter substrate-binding protein [Pyramidobacter sp. CG50-2]